MAVGGAGTTNAGKKCRDTWQGRGVLSITSNVVPARTCAGDTRRYWYLPTVPGNIARRGSMHVKHDLRAVLCLCALFRQAYVHSNAYCDVRGV